MEAIAVIVSPHPSLENGRPSIRAWCHATYDAALGLLGLLTGAAYASISANASSPAAASLPFLWMIAALICLWAILYRKPQPELFSLKIGILGKDETCSQCCEGGACQCCRPRRCSNCFNQFMRSVAFFFAMGWTILALSLVKDHMLSYPPLGDFADVYTGSPVSRRTRLHYYCTGNKTDPSQPTVLLEHGGGSSHANFIPLQRLLEGDMRVCSYDRQSYGYSQPGLHPLTDQQSMEQALQVLAAAGETGPIVCAGHSAGGHKCLYLNKHTDRVIGIALLDGYCNNGSCNIERKWWTLGESLFDRMLQARLSMVDVLRWLQVLAIGLAIGGGSFEGIGYSNYNYHQWRVWDAQFLEYRYSLNRDWADEELSMWTAPNQTSTPIIAVGAGVDDTCAEAGLLDDDETCQSFLHQQTVTKGQLAMYAATSTKGKVMYCRDGCHHGFVWEKPEAAADVIRELVGMAS